MALILSLETSTKNCSVALHKEGELLTVFSSAVPKSHSRIITILIQQVLLVNNLSVEDLDAIAVSEGPGSYTGLRIGASTAKGLCYASGIKLIAVKTLEGMTAEISRFNCHDGLFCPMIDARRMEVYTAIYKNSEVLMDITPLILDENSFEKELSQDQILFFGNGAKKFSSLLNNKNAEFIHEFDPSAAGIGYVAWEKFKKEVFEDVIYFEPFYLKEFNSTGKKS